MTILINICIFFANLIYIFFKILPTNKNKITFISRQSNEVALDFKLAKKEMLKINKDLKIVELCKTIDPGIFNKIKYFFHMFKQMYHIATSKVVVLDTYCILICILHHKKSLKVIQIWHALGSLKKFSYSSLDTKDGRNSKISKAMRMHKNYDYIFTSSEKSLPNFQEAFNAKRENMVVMPLPRVDFLKSKDEEKRLRKEFYEAYPKVSKKKKNILYCPTSRKEPLPLEEIINSTDLNKFNLILKLHDNTNKIYYENDKYYDEIIFSGMEMLHIADYIISDYSAIVYEAAITNKPIYLYIYDYDRYIDERGLYIDFKKEMPGIMSKDIKTIMRKIEKNEVDLTKEQKFVEESIYNVKDNWSKNMAEFIIKQLGKGE